MSTVTYTMVIVISGIGPEISESVKAIYNAAKVNSSPKPSLQYVRFSTIVLVLT